MHAKDVLVKSLIFWVKGFEYLDLYSFIFFEYWVIDDKKCMFWSTLITHVEKIVRVQLLGPKSEAL